MALTLNEYQMKAMDTCTDTSANFSYMMLNLVGEVGEFAGKVAKGIRKGEIACKDNGNINLYVGVEFDKGDVNEAELRKEAGDILWQLSGLCSLMGWDLEDVAVENLEKLASRKARGVIVGSGDNR